MTCSTPTLFDSYVEEECSADKNLYEAYMGYKEARDTLNQVRRGPGFWTVIAIPAPDGRSASLMLILSVCVSCRVSCLTLRKTWIEAFVVPAALFI